MTGPLLVLGVNTAHDASACLLRDGELVVAIAEERLSRRKHHEGLPVRAIDYCLAEGGLGGLSDLDCVVMNKYEFTDHEIELRQRGYAGELVTNHSHHMLHAYYAWVASGFRDAAVLVIDGCGYSYGEYVRRGSPMLGDRPPECSSMEEAESQYVVRDGKMEVVSKRWAAWEASEPYYRFASLGHMFSMASQYIFGHMAHAGKTMGLAPYGDASAFPEPFIDLRDGEMRIDTAWVTRLPPRTAAPAHLDRTCVDLAAKVQEEVERAALHLVEQLHDSTGLDRLCLSGGVALNSVVNGRIVRESRFSDLFVTPAAGDSGIAIGAALYGHHRLTGTIPRWDYRDDYHGRRYRDDEISAALRERASRLRWEAVPDAAASAAEEIAAGRVIGWFEGGSEFGPRSLGHRSILCDPRGSEMRNRLNTVVKYREPFRPYAASVLSEYQDEWFEMPVDDPFMLVVAPVREPYRAVIESVNHVDDTCRLQSLRAGHEGGLRRVVAEFHSRTGVPLVLNTSFNIRGEPIVETPGEAMDCFLASNIDVLYVESYRVNKVLLAAAPEAGRLVPFLNNGVVLGVLVSSEGGAVHRTEHFVQTRTGHRAPISVEEFRLLCNVDGVQGLDSIAQSLGVEPDGAAAAFGNLQVRGFVSFGFGEESQAEAAGGLPEGPGCTRRVST